MGLIFLFPPQGWSQFASLSLGGGGAGGGQPSSSREHRAGLVGSALVTPQLPPPAFPTRPSGTEPAAQPPEKSCSVPIGRAGL